MVWTDSLAQMVGGNSQFKYTKILREIFFSSHLTSETVVPVCIFQL
jgi:hypothetical protein